MQNPYNCGERLIKIKIEPTVHAKAGEPKGYVSGEITTPVHLDMFLPMLFEDPTKTAAWRVGMPFRNYAEGAAMMCFGSEDTRVYEYRKTGQGIAARGVREESAEDTKLQIEMWSDYMKKALEVTKQLESARRWRFMVMELTLADLSMDGKDLPAVKSVLEVVSGKPSTTWDLLQLAARYQAEYFSLMMLKQVLGWFCKQYGLTRGSGGVQGFAELVNDLPGIAEFFDDDDVNQEQWMALEGEFRNMFSIESDN